MLGLGRSVVHRSTTEFLSSGKNAVATAILVQERPHGRDHAAEIGAAGQQHAAAAISAWLAMIFFSLATFSEPY